MAVSNEEDLSCFCSGAEERVKQFWQIRKALRLGQPTNSYEEAKDLFHSGKGVIQKMAKKFIRKGMLDFKQGKNKHS